MIGAQMKDFGSAIKDDSKKIFKASAGTGSKKNFDNIQPSNGAGGKMD